MSNTLATINADLVCLDVDSLVDDFKLEFVSGDGVVASVTARVSKDKYLVLQIEDGMFTGIEGEFSFPILDEDEEE